MEQRNHPRLVARQRRVLGCRGRGGQGHPVLAAGVHPLPKHADHIVARQPPPLHAALDQQRRGKDIQRLRNGRPPRQQERVVPRPGGPVACRPSGPPGQPGPRLWFQHPCERLDQRQSDRVPLARPIPRQRNLRGRLHRERPVVSAALKRHCPRVDRQRCDNKMKYPCAFCQSLMTLLVCRRVLSIRDASDA